MNNIIFLICLPFFASALSGDYETIGYGFAVTICAAIVCLVITDRQNMGDA